MRDPSRLRHRPITGPASGPVCIKHQQCSERPFPSAPAGFQAHYRPPVAPTSHAHQSDGPGPQRCRTPHLEIEWSGSSTVATLSGAAGRFLPGRPIRGQRTCVGDRTFRPYNNPVPGIARAKERNSRADLAAFARALERGLRRWLLLATQP